MNRFTSKFAVATIALAIVVSMIASLADARIGGGRSSFGSRGARTWNAPAVTRTAPNPAAPIQRSTIPQTAPTTPGTVNPTGRTGASGGFFRQPGFLGGIATGLLGAGLLGMLFGHGFLDGLSGGGSMLGLLLQLAIVFFLARWAIRAFAGRGAPAFAGGPAQRDAAPSGMAGPSGQTGSPAGFRFPSFGGSPAGREPEGQSGDELDIPQSDLDTFETMLRDVQEAYGREDVATLRRLTTPEMLSYLVDEITDNASRGVVNRVSNVRLLQGDVAESWSEGDTDYVTVAMQYSLDDVIQDRDTGQVVQVEPSEATELWTLRRARSGKWLLSAIQQA